MWSLKVAQENEREKQKYQKRTANVLLSGPKAAIEHTFGRSPGQVIQWERDGSLLTRKQAGHQLVVQVNLAILNCFTCALPTISLSSESLKGSRCAPFDSKSRLEPNDSHKYHSPAGPATEFLTALPIWYITFCNKLSPRPYRETHCSVQQLFVHVLVCLTLSLSLFLLTAI